MRTRCCRALFWRRGIAKVLPTEHGIALHRLIVLDRRVPTTSAFGHRDWLRCRGERRRYRGVVSWQHGTESLRTERAFRETRLPRPRSRPLSLPDTAMCSSRPIISGTEFPIVPTTTTSLTTWRSSYAIASAPPRPRSRNAQIAVPPGLFLSGFSEGGHAALAAHRLLESAPLDGLSLRASAPVAAPGDLAGAGLTGALTGDSKYCSLYIAWLATTYARHYREPLVSVLASAVGRCRRLALRRNP